MGTPVFANPQLWAWAAIAVAAAWLVSLLSPILAPFLFAAILGYILDPMVEKLTARRLPRTLADLYERVRARKDHSVAVGAVARHLAEATYWVLARQESYHEPQRKLKAVSSTNG